MVFYLVIERKTFLTVFSILRITKRTVQRHACAVVTPLSTKAPIFDKPSGDDGNLRGKEESNPRFYLEMVIVKVIAVNPHYWEYK